MTTFQPLPGDSLSMKQKGQVTRQLVEAWDASGGLMLIRAGALSPARLISLAGVFGEVEDCHETHVHPRMVSAEHSAIFRVTNELDPQTVSATATPQTSDGRPPPSPALTHHRGVGALQGEPLFGPPAPCEAGEAQEQFPGRRGWHTE